MIEHTRSTTETMKFSHKIIIIAAIVFPSIIKASILVGSSLRGVERHIIEKSTKKGKRKKATKTAKVSKPSGNNDTSSSSVDLGSVFGNDNTCVPSSGTWGGKSFNKSGPTSFETCYKFGPTGEECWSKSYFNDCDDVTPWKECQPQGYTGDDQGWNFLNSGSATSTCGSPCEIVDEAVAGVMINNSDV